ncbi:MAG: YkgJ family cysteine cluster protein [Planctomycetes bacterium]|nr:YkgJ family cysteine cluster protein [Planctomycetota bacterium]
MSATEMLTGAAACARCATLQKTCCQRAEILVTEGDVRRITAHAQRVEFFEHRAPHDPEYLVPDEQDPHWLQYTCRADGTRRVLQRKADGDCTFLRADGCTLPLEVRPLVCRLYPFAYTEQGITGVDSEYCPTRALATRDRPMTEVLGIDASAAEDWRQTLYQELRDGTP